MCNKYMLIGVGIVVGVLLSSVAFVLAGNPDSSDVPANTQSYTLDDIYDRLVTGADGVQSTFTEPSVAPGTGTMHDLNDIMNKAPAKDDTSGATAADVMADKKFWGLTGGQWGLQTGSLATREVNNTTVSQLAGYYDAFNLSVVDTDLASGNIHKGVSIYGVAGDPDVVNTSSGDAAAGDILQGKKAWVDGSEVTGNVAAGDDVSGPDGSKTFNILDGLYSGKTATANDSDLVACNIKCGVTIFGVAGTILPECVAKTGQTSCWNSSGGSILCTGTGQDGEYQKGCPPAVAPSYGSSFGGYNRTSFTCSGGFTDNEDGTVTDNLTGLIWLKDANCWGERNWADALILANGLASGNCGLTDGSTAGDWRLPNINELRSLFDPGRPAPYLPAGHPFTGVQSRLYWSSTTFADDTTGAWLVLLDQGLVIIGLKADVYYVWPVRGGQ